MILSFKKCLVGWGSICLCWQFEIKRPVWPSDKETDTVWDSQNCKSVIK